MKLIPTRPTYNSCEELPLSNFIKIVTTGELKHLYSKPAKFIHKQADLAIIWGKIFNEYNDLTNNTQATHIFHLTRDIVSLHTKIQLVNDCVSLLLNVDDIAEFQPTIDILHSYGCQHIEITNDNKEQSLKRCISVCKTFLIELSKSESEYNLLNKDDGKKTTTQDFYDNIAYLSKFIGFPIPLHTTTVSLYISYLNQLRLANTKENAK